MESCEESPRSIMQRTCGFVPHRRQTAGRCTGTMGAWETNDLRCNSARHLRIVSRQRHFHSGRNNCRQRSPAKKAKYTDIANTHMFIPVALDTGGPWNVEAIELIQEIGRRITLINGETRETEYFFSTHLNRHSKGQPSGLPEHLWNRTQFLTPRNTVSNKPHI